MRHLLLLTVMALALLPCLSGFGAVAQEAASSSPSPRISGTFSIDDRVTVRVGGGRADLRLRPRRTGPERPPSAIAPIRGGGGGRSACAPHRGAGTGSVRPRRAVRRGQLRPALCA